VGHVNEKGEITWLKEFSNAETNQRLSIPASIESKSTLFGMVTHNIHTFPPEELMVFVFNFLADGLL
jgi:hypothetical protein